MTMVIAARETGLACEVADQVMCLDAGAVVESDPVNRISSPPGTIRAAALLARFRSKGFTLPKCPTILMLSKLFRPPGATATGP